MPSYLAVPGIQGDSTAARHHGEIEVDAWSFGCSLAAATHHASGAGAGRPQFTEATFSCRGGRASPLLLEFCATGRSVPEAVLTQDSTNEDRPVTEVRFGDGRITSYTASGADAALRDEVRLSFTRVIFSVRTQRADGSLGAPVTTTQTTRAQPVRPAPQPPLPTPGSGGVWRPRTPPPSL